MKVTVWLATRDRETWIALAEILVLAVLLTVAVQSFIAQAMGFAILAHLGYTAMTGLPIRAIPGRPPGGQPRRNLDLRAQIAAFLREVRRVDAHSQRALITGLTKTEIDAQLRQGEQRVMAAAVRVARETRRPVGERSGMRAEETV